MKRQNYVTCGLIGLSLLGADRVYGVATDKFWVQDATSPGTFSGNLADTNHWSNTAGGVGGASLPDMNDYVFFANARPTAYEVDLTASTTYRRVQFDTDKVILDLNDKILTIPGYSGTATFPGNQPSWLRVGYGDGVNADVTLTSSTATKGKLDFPSANGNILIGYGSGTLASTAKLTIQNGASLSRVSSGGTTVGAFDGSQAILDINGGSLSDSIVMNLGRDASVDVTVRNGGKLNAGGTTSANTGGFFFGMANTLADATIDITVDGPGSTMTGRATYGTNSSSLSGTNYRQNTTILVTNGGTVSAIAGSTTAQYYGFADGARGNNTTALTTVEGAGSTMRSGFHYVGGNTTQAARSNHQVIARNDGILGAKALLKVWEAADTGAKGTVTLDDGFVELDGATTISSVTYTGTISVGGILRGNGTIRRQAGTGINRVTVDILGTAAGTWAGATAVNGELRPGDTTTTPAVGNLRIENGNLNLTTNGTQAGTLYLDLAADSGHDQVVLEATAANSGLVTASLLGALDYTIGAGFDLSSQPFYDFVIAQDILHTPLSDDLVSTLSSLGYAAGVDYEYGVVTVAAGEYENDQYVGYKALRLSPVPEPAAFGLLAISGLLLGRRRALA